MSPNHNGKIIELKQFFSENKIPKQIRLYDHLFITDTKVFVETHMKICENYSNRKIVIPYICRLEKLKELCS